jgi:hypothetical protein
MDLRTKINNFLDFANPYSIKKFLGICEQEFRLLTKKEDAKGLEYLIGMVEDVLSELEDFCKTNTTPKIYTKRIKGLLDYMRKNQ